MSPRVQRLLFVAVAAVLLGDIGALVALDRPDGTTSRRRAAASATAAATADAGTDPSGATPAGTLPVDRPAVRASDPGAPPTQHAAAERPRDAAPPEIDRGEFLYALEVAPACATRLQEVTATIKAVPGTYYSLAVAYSDAQGHGAMSMGPVGADGTATFRWVVPPVAAYGRGYVLTTARNTSNGTDGRNIAAFDVVEDAASC